MRSVRLLAVAVLAVVLAGLLCSGFMVEPARATAVTLYATGDACIFSGTPDMHQGRLLFSVGSYATPLIGIWRGLVIFDLSSIPAGSSVNSATLQLYKTGMWGDMGWEHVVYRATAAWDEATVTWNSAGGGQYDPAGSPPVRVQAYPQSYYWDVTGIVRDWIENGMRNYGFVVISTGIEIVLGHRGSDFQTRHSKPQETRPYLQVDFDPPQGVVGGEIVPVNGFAVFSPWLAVIGLVGCVATVAIVVRKRRP